MFRKALSLPAVAQVDGWALAVLASRAAARAARRNFMEGLRGFGRIIETGNREQGIGNRKAL
jgi:hypothetical protein